MHTAEFTAGEAVPVALPPVGEIYEYEQGTTPGEYPPNEMYDEMSFPDPHDEIQ
jgi:hypothetical protein